MGEKAFLRGGEAGESRGHLGPWLSVLRTFHWRVSQIKESELSISLTNIWVSLSSTLDFPKIALVNHSNEGLFKEERSSDGSLSLFQTSESRIRLKHGDDSHVDLINLMMVTEVSFYTVLILVNG